MKKIMLTAFIAAGMLFTSCNDDDNTTDDGKVDVSKIYLPSKIVNEDYITTFTYNEKAQVTKIDESDGYQYIFTYSGNKLEQIIEIENYDGKANSTLFTFSQTGTNVTLNVKGEYNGQTHEYSEELIVDNNGNLINDGYFTYSYDTNGNVVRMASDDGGSVDLTFDSKNGIYKNMKLPQWIMAYVLEYQPNLANNLVKMVLASEEDPEENMVGTVKYEYNADDYPTKMTASSDDDDDFVQTIEYTKK